MGAIRSFGPEKNHDQIEEFYRMGETLAKEARSVAEFLNEDNSNEEKTKFLAGKIQVLGSSCGSCHDMFRK